ncbi:hypothetical protein HGR_12222 [Hylemonella gracilis ATCC 19624]|uniref:Uncharacterized protein n=1 Tax=Hylemonella gracilis ATCC 19624 TaxID=887062 RepID=F3KVF7_9BURK|nr:hypothetical protein HGR_12222 [Hylemonella gracilis ATCC 19624]
MVFRSGLQSFVKKFRKPCIFVAVRRQQPEGFDVM